MQADVINTLRCERTNVTDVANNYLHTHWDMLLECNYQPALMAYTSPGLGQAPVYTPGTMPGVTDLAILSRMLQPRGLLKITAGGSVILETPALFNQAGVGAGRYPCDVKGGPTVKMVGVPKQIGFRHWVINLAIVADVRDATPGQILDTNAVVSNTWVSTEDIDYQRRSVRRFAGRAILRADIMRHFSVNANSFRDLFLFKCPDHYQRMNVSVQLSEDGTVADWSFEDVMRGYDLGVGSEILDIECFRTSTNKRNSPMRFAADLARNLSRVVAGVDLGAVSITAGFISAAIENLPCTYMHCRCDIRGDRNANLGTLTRIAYGICKNQLGSSTLALLTGTNEVTFRQDIADEVFTSVEMSSMTTADGLFTAIREGTVAAIETWLRDPGALNDILRAGQDAASFAMDMRFFGDSRNLTLIAQNAVPGGGPPIIPAAEVLLPGLQRVVVASRQGDPGFTGNPPLLRGAFGTEPQDRLNQIPPPIRDFTSAAAVDAVTAAALPQGNIPAGVEYLIVQALLGQNQIPPTASTLQDQS
jgi:hypothetical protein